jgi:hypothetical protein
LALFRVALGLIVLALTLQLAPDFDAFYGSTAHPQLIWLLLHVVLPFFALLLTLGCFARVCALVCWLGVIAVQQANPAILSGADRLLHLLLFWSIFLPLGDVWSVESVLGRKPGAALTASNHWAGLAIALQVAFVYWFAALSKTDPVWTQNHNALYYALNIEYLTSPWGVYLLQFPALLRWLTAATTWLEYLGPLLLFVPFQRDRCRMAAVILFLIFHLVGMQTLLEIGFFPWVCATAWLIFIPGSFWDKFTGSARARATAAPPAGWLRLLDRGLTCLIFFSIVDMLAWNIAALRGSDAEDWLTKRDPTKSVLHLDQHWRMYAPFPLTDHGWLVIPADLADGSQVDLFTNHAVSWAKPANILAYLGRDRWRVYIGDLFTNQDPVRLQQYADYLTTRWNEANPENKVSEVSIIFMKMTTHSDLTVTGPERETLFTQKY